MASPEHNDPQPPPPSPDGEDHAVLDPAHSAPPMCERPDWVPENASAAFATWVIDGVRPSGDFAPPQVSPPRRRQLSIDDYVNGIQKKDTMILARAITLVESNVPAHQEQAQQLLARILPLAGRSMRVGITGIPGAGKSTAIEALGCHLCEKGHRLAVLAVDPSSSVTGGSILGDKVRMEKLSRQPGAFIRPSPSGGSLGGVARKSREAILLCEAAGYDIIIVETVGVGQNEITVRSMVDCFLLLSIAGAGDEVQGIKKGVMEIADLLVVNKADGDNKIRAMAARAELERVLQYLQPATDGWKTPALTASAITGEGIAQAWETVLEFFKTCRMSGMLDERRRKQAVDWTHSLIREALLKNFYQSAPVRAHLEGIEQAVANGEKPSLAAAQELLALWRY